MSRLVGILGLAALLLVVGAMQADATETAWKLYDRDQDQPTARFAGGPTELLCGTYGTFFLEFGSPLSSNLAASVVEARDEGQEIPPEFPLVTSDSPTGRFVATRGKRAGFRSTLTRSDAPTPCDGASCFEAPGRNPWVAVVDWDNWHGWSVGWTILQTSESQVGVSLLPLDDPILATYFGERITDVHLLAQLCHLAEMVEDPAISPPVAVNLSFGRSQGLQDFASTRCQSSSLSCQIGQVLEHLVNRSVELAPERANPLVVFAAAGNHGKLLFPASDPLVTSVGSLDLQDFHQQGRTQPSWETPDAADALFPGAGLCLEYSTATGSEAAWAAPPGSSYSTALLTGWVAPSLESQRLPNGQGRWAPARICRGRRCSFDATKGGKAYGRSTSAAQGLVEGTAADQETSCTPELSDGEISLSVPLAEPHSLAALPALSFPEISPSLLAPTPAPAPCVPCEERLNRPGNGNGNGKGNGSNQTIDLTGSGLGVTAGSARKKKEPQSLAVQLASGPAMSSGLVLDTLYLRVETTLYPVELSRRQLWQLESGAVDLLEIDLGPYELPKKHQPSLIWVLRGPSAAGGEVETWTSTPILLRTK